MASSRVLKTKLKIIDVAQDVKNLTGLKTGDVWINGPLPEHDYRFELDTPTGGTVTFNKWADAKDIVEYARREGWTRDE
jgi:hypothetical protein